MHTPSETHSAEEPQAKIDSDNVAAEHKEPEEVQNDKAVTEESASKNADQTAASIDADIDEPPPKPGFIPRGSTSYPVSGGGKPPGKPGRPR